MKRITIRSFLSVDLLLIPWLLCPAYSQTIFGVSGLIKSPDAYVVDNGKCAISLGYYFDDNASTTTTFPNIPQLSASFIVGPVSRIEVSFRVTAFLDVDKIEFRPRNFTIDLNVNIKGVIVKERKYVPQISLGIQDVVGTWRFHSTYLVVSKTIKFGEQSYIAGSLEYNSAMIGDLSHDITGKSPRDYRFLGIFGNLEIQPFRYLSLLADYDAEDWNMGLRLNYKNIVYGKCFISEFKYLGGLIGVKFNL